MILRRGLAAAALASACCLGGCQSDDHGALAVVVSLPEQDVAGAAKATLLVDYSGTGAKILTEGSGPACAFILPGIDGEFADDHKGTLTVHTSGPRALRGGTDIVACRMKAGGHDVTAATLQAKLSVRVVSAEDAAGKAIDLTTKGPKSHGAAAARSEDAIEAAQEEAVKAAASAAPPPAPTAAAAPAGGAGGSATQGNAVSGSSSGRPGAGVTGVASAPAGAPGAPTAAPKQAVPVPPKPVATGSLLNNPAAAAANAAANRPTADDGAVSANPDRDPSYDDSSSQDERTPAYTVEIAVTSTSRFGALQLEITHLGNSGGFIGRGDKVDCVSLVEAIVASNYPGERSAKIGLISLQGIPTPAAILRCGFRTREAVSPAAFQVQVADASDTNSEALDPPPTVVVSSVMRR